MDFQLSVSLNANVQTEEALQRIDDAILALKSQRNALMPVSRLPPELVHRIFLFVKALGSRCYGHGDGDGEGDDDDEDFGLKWINLTQVSRHWRAIAINSASLWADLPIQNFQWVEEMLKRSKDAPLVVDAHFLFSNHAIPAGLELALKHSMHIKDLSLVHVTHEIWKCLTKYLPKFAPRLERLTIEGRLFSEDCVREQPLSNIPEDILCKTERLRYLKLFRCNINWNSHSLLLHSLTHLEIRGLPRMSTPNGKQFFDILKGMPDLEYLSLIDAFSKTGEQASCGSVHIHFPLLRTLQLRAANIELEAFFSCITFPPTATVHVEVEFLVTAPNTSSSGVILNLARSYSNLSFDKAFQALVLDKSTSYKPSAENPIKMQFRLKLFMKALANEQMFGNSCTDTPPLRVDFLWKKGTVEQPIAKLTSDIFNSPILQYVKHVYLAQRYQNHEFDTETITNTIGMLPSVQSVMVGGTPTGRHFFDTLKLCPHAEDTGSAGNGPAKTIYFPSLSSICLYTIKFDDAKANNDYRLTIGMLQDCLTYRKQSGAEIRKLALWNCAGLEEKDRKSLAKVVVDVNIKTVEDDVSDDDEY